METQLATHLLKQHPSKLSKSKSRPLPVVDIHGKNSMDSLSKVGSKGVVKEDYILKILKYQCNKRFGPIINKELGFKNSRVQLTKHNIDSLETILHRIRTHLNTRNMDKVFEHMVKVSAKGYEDLVSGFGYDIDGFTELLLSNPAFHDAFERWKIEREIIDVPPSFQLMYIVASTTYMAHLTHPHKKAIQQPKPQIQSPVNKKDQQEPNIAQKHKYQPGDIII